MAFGGDVLPRAPPHEAPRRPTCSSSWQREGPTLVSYRYAIWYHQHTGHRASASAVRARVRVRAGDLRGAIARGADAARRRTRGGRPKTRRARPKAPRRGDARDHRHARRPDPKSAEGERPTRPRRHARALPHVGGGAAARRGAAGPFFFKMMRGARRAARACSERRRRPPIFFPLCAPRGAIKNRAARARERGTASVVARAGQVGARRGFGKVLISSGRTAKPLSN